jgi:hypothetical protein
LNYNSEVKKSLVQCRTILAFDKNKVLDNEFFNEKRFDEVREECDERFNF